MTKQIERKWESEIVPLERSRWEGHRLEFRYISHSYYDVEITQTDNDFTVTFFKKPYEVPFEKKPDDYDKLFQPWWEDVKAWGIIKNEQLIAAVETAVEGWSNRLIVTELWVDDAYRRQGIATALMDKAIHRAKEEKRRVLMLETQSCNTGAIGFYLKYGFSLIGFDSCAYQNNDLERNEVRLNMGIIIGETG